MKLFIVPSVHLIRFYQRWISPLFSGSCRFIPSCSEYTLEAISKYGVCGKDGYWGL